MYEPEHCPEICPEFCHLRKKTGNQGFNFRWQTKKITSTGL
jgi:hypothetical protein